MSPNAVGFNLTNWFWVVRTLPGQTNLTVTNLTATECYFRLAGTNDTDGGGFSDAFEQLVTHTDPNDPTDDRLVPLVGIYVTDSIAIEQESTNTAKCVLRRRGGTISWPLTVGCELSGTASYGSDYSLWPVTLTPTNVLVSFAPGQTTVELTLMAMNDSVSEGAETATLTLVTNLGPCELDTSHASATGWILEGYTKTFTTVADFNLGVRMGLEAAQGAGDGQLQFQANLPPQFPFINVACSGRGTVVRINTTNGEVIGEYLTAPANIALSASPSRTTVDQYGNVWVANRRDTLSVRGTNYGSITRIGLIIGGSRFSKSNGVYYPDPNGQYVALSNALYNTCIDRDGDGFIRTSRGLADILPWDNPDDVDTYGGVSTAEDEAITEYVRVASPGTRTIAVDKFNDIWVGGTDNRKHLKVDGLTGKPIPNSVFDPQAGGYGGVIDALGNLWSSSTDSGIVRLVPPAVMPPTTNDWQVLYGWGKPYGIAVDPLYPYIWQTTYGEWSVFRWHTNGALDTNSDGSTKLFWQGASHAKGIVVDTNGHVWVAHDGGTTVGHLDTNGVYLGSVQMRLTGLRGEYFANTNFSGTPALVTNQGPLDFNWGHGAPAPNLPSNYFSVRWLGVLEPQREGEHVLILSADPGAAVALTLEGQTVSSNWWTEPGPYPVELHLTNSLQTNMAYSLKVEYIEFTGEARVRLSWIEPDSNKPVVIPLERFIQTGTSPHGVSVDATGKIWVANYGSDNTMRIDPNAGPIVITTNAGVRVTNHVGVVDMVVDLGDGTFHPWPYNKRATPYNYSDMTGFNNRIVNPTGQPFKGYWMIIHDCGQYDQFWDRVSWNAHLPEGCGIEVYVRASNDRAELSTAAFVPVTNNAPLVDVSGRYIEVRVALVRDDPAKRPVLYDLTLHGLSTSFLDWFLDNVYVQETQDAEFWPLVLAPEPLNFQWYGWYPWVQDWMKLPEETNAVLVRTNVDLLDHTNWFGALVTCATGERMFVGPAFLWVVPSPIWIPGSGSSGAASRYPATFEVFEMPTNGLQRVEVWLYGLTHSRPEDLDILLVSPSGAKIMLMSDAGGTNQVSNATLVFHPNWMGYSTPPETNAIPSNHELHYRASNFGELETQLPGAPAGPYTDFLDDLPNTDPNPNGVWKLYIYDDKSGQTGVLEGSWSLKFYYNP